MTALLKIGLVSVSDRASSGVYQDQGIPELQQWLEQALVEPFEVETRLIPDEQPLIEQTLKELVDEYHCHLVLTTGGTGPASEISPGDSVAEAQAALYYVSVDTKGEIGWASGTFRKAGCPCN